MALDALQLVSPHPGTSIPEGPVGGTCIALSGALRHVTGG